MERPALALGYIRLDYGVSEDANYVDLKCLYAKGLDDPEIISYWPPIINTYLDGSIGTQYTSFRRGIRFSTVPILDRNDRMKVVYWGGCNTRKIDYNFGAYVATGLSFCPKKSEYELSWINGFSKTKSLVDIECDESTVRALVDGWPNEAVA